MAFVFFLVIDIVVPAAAVPDPLSMQLMLHVRHMMSVIAGMAPPVTVTVNSWKN